MMISKILAVFLVLAAFHLDADTRQYDKSRAFSDEILESITGNRGILRSSHYLSQAKLHARTYSLGTERMPREVMFLWRKEGDHFRLAHVLESFQGETFDKPVPFAIGDLQFINVPTTPAGSGGFVANFILWVAPDGSVHNVNFEPASEAYEGLAGSDQIVLNGGEKEFFYEDDTMRFEFAIAEKGDPHCCPSGGLVTGTYKLVGQPKFDSFTRKYTPDFQIKVDQIQHAKQR